MRIVLINWAPIWEGAAQGGGVNQYAQALALELIGRGHDVYYLFGGITILPDAPEAGLRKDCFWRRHDDWLGVKVFEVINSPVLAPSIRQFKEPLGEVVSPVLDKLFADLIAQIAPDAIHWNNIEGFSAGCVRAVRESSPKTRQIFSLHNYHTICPQVYLMQGHRRTCYDFDNGHNCTNCVDFDPPGKTRAEIQHRLRHEHGEKQAAAAFVKIQEAWDVLRGPWLAKQAYRKAIEAKPGMLAQLMPGRAMDAALVRSPMPPKGKDDRGKTPYLMTELNPPKPLPPDAPERMPLLNVIQPEPPNSKPPNDYAKRRAAMVEMLNTCDRVLAVSEFVRRKFVSMGVREERIETLAIGSRINRVIDLKPDLIFAPPRFEPQPTPWQNVRPMRLHFMGYNNYYKGLPVVAEALEMMAPEHLRQIDLSIFALDGHTIEWMFRRLEPRLAKMTFKYEYNYHDIPWMLGGKDLTIVPSVWWDNAPQTVFESLTCGVPVLGANIGGIPDFVQDGVNGLLFTANSREHLRDRLIEVVEQPWMVERLRANVRPCKSIHEHMFEIEAVYAGR